MRLRKLLAPLVSLAAGLIMMVSTAAPVFGATSASGGTGNGLKVSPVVSNIVVDAGQTQTVTIYVQNVTSSSIALQAVVNDFIASDNETGQPALLLDPGQYAPSHSLKRLVAPIDNFILQAGERKSVVVSITVPKTAPGGGYYGAIRFAPASIPGGSNVTLSASVGSLILVKVPGKFKEDVRLISFDAISGTNGSPQVLFFSPDNLMLSARFQNQGDVQEQPFGKVLLKQGDKQLASYEINNTTPRGNVLPDSIRKFTVSLNKVGFFGQYTLVGNFGYSTNGQLLSGQTTFYVIPLAAIVLVVVVLLLIVFLIFGFPRLMRAYNAGVLRRAGRR